MDGGVDGVFKSGGFWFNLCKKYSYIEILSVVAELSVVLIPVTILGQVELPQSGKIVSVVIIE